MNYNAFPSASYFSQCDFNCTIRVALSVFPCLAPRASAILLLTLKDMCALFYSAFSRTILSIIPTNFGFLLSRKEKIIYN